MNVHLSVPTMASKCDSTWPQFSSGKLKVPLCQEGQSREQKISEISAKLNELKRHHQTLLQKQKVCLRRGLPTCPPPPVTGVEYRSCGLGQRCLTVKGPVEIDRHRQPMVWGTIVYKHLQTAFLIKKTCVFSHFTRKRSSETTLAAC